MTTNWRALRCGCLILTGVMLGGSPAFVRGQESAGASMAAAVISSVAISQDQQRAAIRVEGAGRLDVHAARMQNPERLVLDFAGARMGVQKTSIPGVSAPVRGVRLGQFRPDVARVVIDLTGSAPYQIAHEGECGGGVPGSAIVGPQRFAGSDLDRRRDHEKRDFLHRKSSSCE